MILDHRTVQCAADGFRELAEVAIAKGGTVDAQEKYTRPAILKTVPRAGQFNGRPWQVSYKVIGNLQGIHNSQHGSESGTNIRLPLRRHENLANSAGERRMHPTLEWTSRNGEVMHLHSDLSEISFEIKFPAA
jgi:hypothetical protein